MVSLDLYLKAFFRSLPRRVEIASRLKKDKATIDRKVINGIELSQQEILTLLEVIGRDSFIRKAEKRKKLTLRHISWWIIKSVKFFQNLSARLDSDQVF